MSQEALENKKLNDTLSEAQSGTPKKSEVFNRTDLINEKLIKSLQSVTRYKDGHWLCYLSAERDGHCRVNIKGTKLLVHRVSASYYLGLDYDDKTKLALHKIECNKPNCWNPEHLYIGTNSRNTGDLYASGFKNNNSRKTHCPKGHEYSKANTIIGLTGSRFCKECQKARNRK